MRRSNLLHIILSLICGSIILAVDQITKYYVSINFELGQTKEFLNGFIDLTYIHNTGGAWGMLSGHSGLLLGATFIIMAVCIVLFFKYATKNKLLFWALSLVISGGMGNIIDRTFRDGKVIDFLHFEFWPQFPVFNIADCAIVVGAGLLILYFVLDTINDYKNKFMKIEI